MPFLCSEANELGKEQTMVYTKVERLVCFLDRLDFEPGRNFCAAQPYAVSIAMCIAL